MKVERIMFSSAGFFLGFLVSVGGLLGRGFFSGHVGLAWLREELAAYPAFYGSLFWLIPLTFAGLGFYIASLRGEITALRVSTERTHALFRGQSVTDEVTGLYHRRHMLETAGKEVERSIRYERPLAGMVIDMDHFTEVNKKHGRQVGDYVLKEVSALIKRSIRHIDVLGRYGADGFLVILPESNLRNAELVARRISGSIEKHRFVFREGVLPITVSIGVASFRSKVEKSKDPFVERAERALLEAKNIKESSVVSL